MRYLFRFGFESPDEFEVNKAQGLDFESSDAVWINASSPQEALEWGRSVAEEFVYLLFATAGMRAYSWRARGFAHWIEDENPILEWANTSPEVLEADFGQMPDLQALVASRSA